MSKGIQLYEPIAPYDFGLRLQEARRRRRLSQSQAASRLGVGRATISSYECGIKNPRFETLRGLALLYRVSLDELMGITPPNPFQGLTKEQEELALRIIEVIKTHPRMW